MPSNSGPTRLWPICACVLIMLVVAACKKNNADPIPTTPQPTVSLFYPTIGLTGSTVTIFGTNFGNKPAVGIGDYAAEVLAGGTETSLTVKVPPDAKTGKISVVVGPDQVTGMSTNEFKVIASEAYQCSVESVLPVAVATDNLGNFYATGTFKLLAVFPGKGTTSGVPSSQTLFSEGNDDIFIVKYANDGTFLWGVKVGTAAQDFVTGIAADGKNIYICGNFSGTTRFGSRTLTSRGGTDIYVATFNNDGSVNNAFQIGGPGNDEASAITIGYAGGITIAGTFEQTLTQASTTLVATGAQSDPFILHTNSFGDVSWMKSISGVGKETINAISSRAEGTVITGAFDRMIALGSTFLGDFGASNIFTYLLNGTGDVLWAQGFICSGTVTPTSISSVGGAVLISGSFSEKLTIPVDNAISAGNLDAFLIRLRITDGDAYWIRRFGGPDDDMISSIAIDPTANNEGRVYFTGYFINTADFGNRQITSTTSQKNIVVGRYGVDGDLQWVGQNEGDGIIEGISIAATNSIMWVMGSFKFEPTVGGAGLYSPNKNELVFWRLSDP